jgi:Uma2 family endonuclease
MSTQTPPHAPPEIEYPDSDGRPMSDNTLQFEWIVTIKGGLDAVFRDNPNVFVAGDLLWYPVEGNNKTRMAPDALVAVGRPKGYRGSYMQWREGGVAPQVVFEVLSPKNTVREMSRKRQWYFRFGVEEYYEFDPDHIRLRGWIREAEGTREVLPISGWVSPRLRVRFELAETLTIFGPDGRPFATYLEVSRQRDEADQLAEHERQRAEHERQRAEHERQRAEHERQRADRLAARLRELGLEPDE